MGFLTGLFGAVNGQAAQLHEALRWLVAAAAQGHAMAQTNLGVCYAEGRGVPMSLTGALYWWRQAGMQDVPDALHNLERLQREHGDAAAWPSYGDAEWRQLLAHVDRGVPRSGSGQTEAP